VTIEAFGAFEGGGAKGFAHIGALKAAEQRNVIFKGVAGTSAGAIVASLYAAGWTADEMFGRDETGQDAGILNIAPKDLVNSQTWDDFASLKRSTEALLRNPTFSLLKLLLLYVKHHKVLHRMGREFGAFDSEGFECWLNEKLTVKIFGGGGSAGNTIMFGDVPIPLKIVAADVDAGRLVCFDHENTPNVPVAKAVSLSISIPFAFKPASPAKGMGRCVDGGLVSNLPVWAFDAEREHGDPLIPTFGFRLDEAQGEKSPYEFDDFPVYAKRVLRTALFGASPLEERGITSLHTARLRTDVDPFNFDITPEQRRRAYSHGLQDALNFFKNEIGPADKRELTTVLQLLAFQLEKRIKEYFQGSVGSVRVRMAVMLPDRQKRRLRVMYTANMDEDADDRLELPINCPGAGTAFAARNPVYIDWEDAKEDFPKVGIDKYILCKVPNDLKSIYSVPIFNENDGAWSIEDPAERPQPLGVLNLDFDCEVQAFCEEREEDDLMTACANQVASILTR